MRCVSRMGLEGSPEASSLRLSAENLRVLGLDSSSKGLILQSRGSLDEGDARGSQLDESHALRIGAKADCVAFNCAFCQESSALTRRTDDCITSVRIEGTARSFMKGQLPPACTHTANARSLCMLGGPRGPVVRPSAPSSMLLSLTVHVTT